MEQLYASQSQPVCNATLCVARDRVKVQSRRKYVFTDQIDRLIRETYHNRQDERTRFNVRALAKKVGMPHWALKKRARELGLARTKELPWSEAELGILARYAWMSDERIRLKLKAAGYSRTVGAHRNTGAAHSLRRGTRKLSEETRARESAAQGHNQAPHRRCLRVPGARRIPGSVVTVRNLSLTFKAGRKPRFDRYQGPALSGICHPPHKKCVCPVVLSPAPDSVSVCRK